jgi:hypothetical protein
MSSVSVSAGSGKRTRFYRQAESAAARILEAFQSANLPRALAPVFVRRRDNVPCRAWSWSNQLLVALAGHSDARGYRQCQEVGRRVRKGEKAFHILVPCVGHRLEKDEDTGEEKEMTWVYGFTSAPVFGLDQTEGDLQHLRVFRGRHHRGRLPADRTCQDRCWQRDELLLHRRWE